MLRAHRAKVARARDILLAAAERGPLVVCSSWGKDSSALCHLACETLPRVEILHQASAYRLPGWERARDAFADRARLHEIAPRRTLDETIEWLHEVGLCFERTGASRTATHRAKREASDDWCDARGIHTQALGLRIDEGGPRAILLRTRGPIYQRADGTTIACPLAYWSSRDVWAYLYAHDVPYHALYDCETHGETRESIRNCGWLTTHGAQNGRIAWLRAHYPEQYRALVAEWPRLSTLA